jgi:nicotinamidase-related amidase
MSGPLRDEASVLLLIDFQARLMPAIVGGEASLREARRLAQAAALLDVPVMLTEQTPDKLGPTVGDLAADHPVLAKATFDATRAPGFEAMLPDRSTVLVAGWETHVCVLQTVLGLIGRRRVAVVADAVGSRTEANRAAGLARMAAEGVEIVTAEMAIFEWLGSAAHPQFRAVLGLVK